MHTIDTPGFEIGIPDWTSANAPIAGIQSGFAKVSFLNLDAAFRRLQEPPR